MNRESRRIEQPVLVETGQAGRAPGRLLLRAENLVKSYQMGSNSLVVLQSVSLEVASGEMIAIVGASGAGKSTLLHLLGGLDRPDSGSIYVEEFDICKVPDVDLFRFRNQKIGFVFQFHHLLPEFTALENTMMPMLIGGKSRRDSFDRAISLLERVGLADRLAHRPGELSGGEQQRIALARALANRPSLLLADEPTGNLDSKTGGAVFELLKQLHTHENLTSVIVTHNEALAAACDRILHLEDGRLHSR